MKVGISRWAVGNPTPVILLFVMLSIAGLVGFFKLPVTGNPKVDLPIVSVSVSQLGASPRELEQNIALKLENALSGLIGMSHLSTTISNGAVELVAEFVLDANIDRAVSDVREAIARVRPELPQSIGEPVITRVDVSSGGAFFVYALRAAGLSEHALGKRVDTDIQSAITSVPGVQQVRRLGGSTRELRVELMPERLNAVNLSINEVLAQIRSAEQNFPAGRVQIMAQSLDIRVVSASTNAQALAARLISLPDGGRIRLDAISTILDGGNEQRGFALLDGEPALILEIFKAKTASEISLADSLNSAISAYQSAHPEVQFDLVYNGAESTRNAYAGALETLVEGTVLTILVVFLFLRDVRATAIAALAIPASLLPTFAAMQLSGFYLDSVSLLALILVIGIVVDDAIVEVENIAQRIQLGESPYQAALVGADQIGLAVIAITAVIVAVFLPVSFIQGVVGKYFVEFGMTVTFAVLSSLVVARLLTPLMCAYWLKPKSHAQAPSAWVQRYVQMLRAVLRNPTRSALAAIGILVLSLGLLASLPTGFLPKTRSNVLSASYELPPGSNAAASAAAAEAIRAELIKISDVRQVIATDNGFGAGELRIVLCKKASCSLDRQTLEAKVRAVLSEQRDIRVNFFVADGAKEFRLDFASTDGPVLEHFMTQLHAQALALPMLRDVETTRAGLQPTLDLQLRPDEMARLGVSPEQLANTLSLATLSELDAQLTRILISDEQVPIRVRVAGGDRLNLDQLKALPIATRAGTVNLASLAELTLTSTPSKIERLDRKRTLAITANLSGASFGEAQAAIEALPAYRTKPSSIRRAQYGDAQYMDEMFMGFALAFLFGLLCVYAVLVLLFADWLQPLTIMAALPFSLGGAALALLMSGHALNLSTLIGLLMLFGIVAKNSILLVDFIIEARATGVARDVAVIQAGTARARPIVMTTLAMVGGMLPAAIGFGADDGFRAPMAIAVIGGLLASTFLSLLFVPWIYIVMDDLKTRLLGRSQKTGAAKHAHIPQYAGQNHE